MGTLRGAVPECARVCHDERVSTVLRQSLGCRLRSVTGPLDDVETLADAVCTTVAVDVPFAFGCLATTDPSTGLITRAFKTHPLGIGDEEFAAAEYGDADVNQFADIAHRSDPVGVLSIDTAGQPENCRRFREFLKPRFGFTDELRVAFRGQGITWGVLALYRGEGDEPFTADDAQTLASVCEVVADAIRRALFTTRSRDLHAGRGQAVVIVDADGRVRDMTAAARERIEDLGGWESGSLPTSVLAVAAAARTSADLATTRALGRAGVWLTLRASTLNAPTARPDVVITMDVAQGADISPLTLAARGLTAREQDVAGLVLQGASTRVIAMTLHLSPHTVQDHLKAIFTKTGVNSRREMIAELLLT